MPARDRPPGAKRYLPSEWNLKKLAEAASGCQGCGLFKNATQTVFGEGPQTARIVLVGEQPGDREDREGRPFVGPAGALLAKALVEAGIEPERTYITNAVKHFKWELRGKRRIHKRPYQQEIEACRPWLEAELHVVKPQVLVCLGVTAASAAFGKRVRLSDYRGHLVDSPLAERTLVTIHPAAVVRITDREMRRRHFGEFVKELRLAVRSID